MFNIVHSCVPYFGRSTLGSVAGSRRFLLHCCIGTLLCLWIAFSSDSQPEDNTQSRFCPAHPVSRIPSADGAVARAMSSLPLNGPRRPAFVLFGDSLTQHSFGPEGWGSSLQHLYARKVGRGWINNHSGVGVGQYWSRAGFNDVCENPTSGTCQIRQCQCDRFLK